MLVMFECRKWKISGKCYEVLLTFSIFEKDETRVLVLEVVLGGDYDVRIDFVFLNKSQGSPNYKKKKKMF